MTVKFIPKDEPDSLVRLSSIYAGTAFWHDNAIHIKCDEVSPGGGEPYVCVRLTSGHIVRLHGDVKVLPTTLELREV